MIFLFFLQDTVNHLVLIFIDNSPVSMLNVLRSEVPFTFVYLYDLLLSVRYNINNIYIYFVAPA